MPISGQFVEEAGELLLKECPLVSADSDASQQVRKKILEYDEKLGFAPSPELVLRFAMPYEELLKTQKAAEEAEIRKEKERQARIDRDFHRPSSEDKLEAIADLKARLPQPVAQEQFKPRKEFTDEEIEAMDSETYAHEIMGVPFSDKNRSVGPPPEARKDRTIRRISYEARRAQEQADRATRQKQISLDEQQKSKLRKDLKAALTGGK